MTPARLLTALAGVPGLYPRADQRIPPVITWDDGPCGRTAAAALTAAGFEVTDPFWGGALVDTQDLEPCVFQRILRPETAALLYLHGTEPDTSDGDARLAGRVFGTDLPGEGYLPTGHEDELAVHLLVGEVNAITECDFGGDALFTQMGEAVRRTFGDRSGLFEIARRAVI
ncbi:hypothetical protein [Actinoplanes derwentensis]|uniref:Uncharacterized protein n=1 Tax=Actinoplanes derwentensis TaxID=113562 RepID=A0A1H1QJP7_9ACTN|nr:hypothetical protein [Actinoplanes derwentensis]GID82122.1 hypothetical protein Ade03nite_10460 [Actinoplanes derwentensis]SDS23616.1 hypothetical protein SAMN04489716_0323 [Actinoplanes derwentensis]